VRPVSVSEAWEEHSADWIAWARAPDHDGFWSDTWPALARVLPRVGVGPALDLGCGEGRAGRLLRESGWEVFGVDRSPTLAAAAATGDPPLPVVNADAGALPFADETFDLVVASMSLQDIDDPRDAITDAGRVLRAGGSLCAAIVHPFCSAQDAESLHTDRFTVSRPYLQARRYEDRLDRDGFAMTFVSMHRPLGDYIGALAAAGLTISAFEEHGDRAVPWLLTFRADRRS